jgi:hypothetical protein
MLIAVGKEECYEAQLELYQRVNLAYRMRQKKALPGSQSLMIREDDYPTTEHGTSLPSIYREPLHAIRRCIVIQIQENHQN